MSTSQSQTSESDPSSRSFSIKQILMPLIAIILGIFMVILDGTAMNVALPNLVKEFNTTLPIIQWSITGYALAQAAVIPLAGWLSDRFGAKRIFLISVALFTFGSLLCTLATDANQLILFRIIQGLGGGMVSPIAMAYTYRLSPKGKVGTVMGIMGIPILFAPASGPVLSGFLIDYASWEWIFLINLPIGIIAIIIGIRTLPNIERQSVPALDILGIILAPLAFAALSYGVSEGGTDWSSNKTIIGLIVGLVALLLFIIVELNRKHPLLELRVFRSSDFTRSVLVQWILQFSLFGTLFLVPLLLQQIKHYSAFETGLIMLPQAITTGFMMPIAGRLSDRLGARPLVISGFIILTFAAYLLSNFASSDEILYTLLSLVLIGIGMGLSMMPLNTHILKIAPQHLVSRITSLTNATLQVISSLAIAGLSTILTIRVEHHMKTEHIAISALGLSFKDVFFVLTGIALTGIIFGFFLKKPKAQTTLSNSKKDAQMIGHL